KNDEEVFDELIGRKTKQTAMSTSDKADALAELVIATSFDLSKLNAPTIAQLLKDGNDLRRFKNSLLPIVQSIPDIPNEQMRLKRYKQAAKEVLIEWQKYKKTLRWYGLDALVNVSEIKFPETVAGAASFVTLG